MKIFFKSLTSFLIQGDRSSILIDPYPRDLVERYKIDPVDLILFSHDEASITPETLDPNSNIDPFLIQTEGEFEIKQAFIATHEKDGCFLSRIVFEGVQIAHLSRIQKRLSEDEEDFLGDIDVLFVPVGDEESLSSELAVKVINSIEPSIVVPMYYAEAKVKKKLHDVKEFLQEFGAENARREKYLKIKSGSIIKEKQEVVVLES